MNKIIYTDGACSGNPGAGGYGVCMLENNIVKHYHSEKCDETTNNREEMKAMLYALKLADSDKENNYIIYSDSAYVVNMCNTWIKTWAANGWIRPKNQPIKNLDLVKELYNYINKNFLNCQIKKVDGHSNILGNEIADALATNNHTKLNKLTKENDLQWLNIDN